MEPESSLPYSQAPTICPYPELSWCVMPPPLEKLPPPPSGDQSGGVFYLRIVLSPGEASRPWVFLNNWVARGGVVSASPNSQAGGPPLVGCSSIRNLRTRHGVVRETHKHRIMSTAIHIVPLCSVCGMLWGDLYLHPRYKHEWAE
jgi:hypothetical protein